MSTPANSHFPIRLRALQAEDAPALEWHGGLDLRAFYQAQWSAHQNGEIYVIIAAAAAADTTRAANFPLGQAAIHWSGKPTHPHIPDIQSLRVHPDLRGQGVGSQLLEECERLVCARGHAQVSLSVALDNHHAKRLYERLNYHVVGAPYSDVWFYADATGKSVRMEETVWDMIKTLQHS